MARKSRRATKILNKLTGKDPELRKMIAEEALNVRVAHMIHEARKQSGLTQARLAELIGTKQPVIARLEDADYEGHSLSMLYRISAALSRKIALTATGDDLPALSVREDAPAYGPPAGARRGLDDSLSSVDLDRFAERIAQRFAEQGVTKNDVREAIRWAREDDAPRSLEELQGTIKVGPGNILDDLRRARAQRGRETGARK